MENLAKIWGLCNEKTEKSTFSRFFILNLINVGPFNKTVGPGKNPKLMNVGPMYVYFGV